MACRKAAYRAMTELSEWMEKRREESDAESAVLEAEQRKIWTPANIFETCCVRWLADGAEVLGYRDRDGRGCSGGCGKAHPRVALDFRGGRAVAVLSHELDPFVRYFDDLCDRGLARRSPDDDAPSGRRYHLKGFLHTHADELKISSSFGTHLVKVSASALAASKRSHERQMECEEMEREAKRCKTRGPPADSDLLESALEVCYNHSLLNHLDLAEIAWMRLSCKTMAKVAARMASSRLQQIRLSYSVLVDGRLQFQEQNSWRTNERDEGCISVSSNSNTDRLVKKYKVISSRLPLSFRCLDGKKPGNFVPKEAKDFEIRLDCDPSAIEIQNENSACKCQGHLIRVYLEGTPTDAATGRLTEEDCLFSDQLEIARHRIHPRSAQVGVIRHEPKFSYEVTSVQDDGPTDASVQRRGTFRLQAINFDFNDLLGIYVRKKLPLAKRRMQEIKQKRPVTRSEKRYVKALAEAARESPGSSWAFEGMKGW